MLARQRAQSPGWKTEAMREYLYWPGSFVPLVLLTREEDSTQTWHYHCDPNGAPFRLTSAEGDIVWSGQDGVWGERNSQPQRHKIDNPLRFQGQYYDAETGLHYNRHRYYDPHIAAYISQDPIGLAGGINPYQYAPNPLMWVDPLGLSCKNVWNQFQSKGLFKSSSQASKAYGLWKKQDWAALEKSMGPGAWPPNRGFITVTKKTLMPGIKVDRYGGWSDASGFRDTGTFLSPAGSSFEGRALPDNTLTKPLSTYEVLKPYDVDAGSAIPWFGKNGMGMQYETHDFVEDLISDGVLKKV